MAFFLYYVSSYLGVRETPDFCDFQDTKDGSWHDCYQICLYWHSLTTREHDASILFFLQCGLYIAILLHMVKTCVVLS